MVWEKYFRGHRIKLKSIVPVQGTKKIYDAMMPPNRRGSMLAECSVKKKRVSNCRKYEPNERRTKERNILLAVLPSKRKHGYMLQMNRNIQAKNNLLQNQYV